jgi:AraC-like DNA-binding protein
MAGISRSHFARAFRNTVGLAPHAFVLQRRLARAVELLTQRKLSIREVAEQCGFADQAHLTRSFKSSFGRPPSLHMPRITARTHRTDRRAAFGAVNDGDRPLKANRAS